jgi:putative FmdB family regulatory protein
VPIYEFVCEACGQLTEVMQKVSDAAPAACAECGKGPMARTVSRTSFQLKGGGWYADLYASKKEKPAPGAKPEAGGAAVAGEKPAAASGGSAPAAPAAAASTAASSGGGGSGSGSGGSGSGSSGGASGAGGSVGKPSAA